MSVQLLIGADPEVFVKSNGVYVSAHNMIPGTKKSPHGVPSGAVQVDGMALEFNIEPAADVDEFMCNLDTVYSYLQEMIPEGHELDIVPTAFFDEGYIKSQPPEATELGCDPDFDAWTGARNPRPNAAVNFRTGAGHIHVGWCEGMDIQDPDHIEACHMMIKQLDCSLGLLSLLWDNDDTRRQLYGKFGAFRPKSYGVEYRTLSNAWLRDNRTKKVVWEITSAAFHSLMDGYKFYDDPVYSNAVLLVNEHGFSGGYTKKAIRHLVAHLSNDLSHSSYMYLRDLEVHKFGRKKPTQFNLNVSSSAGHTIEWIIEP